MSGSPISSRASSTASARTRSRRSGRSARARWTRARALAELSRDELSALAEAMCAAETLPPSPECLSPVGEETLVQGVVSRLEPAFVEAVTRKPRAMRGQPFLVEVIIAYDCKADLAGVGESSIDPVTGVYVHRFVNRVPLLFSESGDVTIKAGEGRRAVALRDRPRDAQPSVRPRGRREHPLHQREQGSHQVRGRVLRGNTPRHPGVRPEDLEAHPQHQAGRREGRHGQAEGDRPLADPAGAQPLRRPQGRRPASTPRPSASTRSCPGSSRNTASTSSPPIGL